MKKIIIIMLASLMIASPVFALQQIAGPLVINVPIGGTGSAKFGLINDDNETITISLRAEGDVADYLSFPTTVDLEPGKIIYTDIIAKIPEDYKSSGNISGFLYALQEGNPGQVKINIQMKKAVTISISEKTIENSKAVETTQPNVETAQSSPITGFITLVSSNSVLIVLIVVLVAIIMLIVIKKRRR